MKLRVHLENDGEINEQFKTISFSVDNIDELGETVREAIEVAMESAVDCGYNLNESVNFIDETKQDLIFSGGSDKDGTKLVLRVNGFRNTVQMEEARNEIEKMTG